MFRKTQERGVLFTYVIKHADCADFVIAQPNDIAAGAAELSLNGKHAFGSAVEMLLKKFPEDVHSVPLCFCVPLLYSASCQTFIPELSRPMMQTCADLRDDLVRQVSCSKCSFVCRNALRDAVQESAREHVAGS